MDRLETCFKFKFMHRFTKNAINAINNAKNHRVQIFPNEFEYLR